MMKEFGLEGDRLGFVEKRNLQVNLKVMIWGLFIRDVFIEKMWGL